MRLRYLLAIIVFSAPAAQAVEYTPVFNATMMGGQYFFKDKNANMAGNATVVAASSIKANERWSWMPMYVANYQGTKGVSDGVAAGSLFQQEMDHRASVTGIYTPEGSAWRLKPSASYKYEFLKQTRDESWGHGLFDFEKIGAGFEAEKVYHDPFSYRLGLDLFRIRFRNYQSLESQAPVDPLGSPLNRSGFNRNVLDTYNAQISVSGARPYPFEEPVVSFQGGYSLLYQKYIDQSLIDSRGQIKSGGRMDFMQTLSGAVGYPRALRMFETDCRLDSKLGINLAYNGSNQGYFDAQAAQFFDDAYSYYSYGAGPSFTLSWGDAKRPTTVATSFNYTHYQYLGRQAQAGSGVYLGHHLQQSNYVLGLSGAYPIAPGFYIKAATNFLWARSNNNFEQTYAYNYRTTNYLMGFTYEY